MYSQKPSLRDAEASLLVSCSETLLLTISIAAELTSLTSDLFGAGLCSGELFGWEQVCGC